MGNSGSTAEFNGLKAHRQETLDRIRSQLGQLLRDQGFETSSELENRVKQIVKGKELEAYNQLREGLDVGDTALSIIWDIIGLVSVGTGAIIGLGYAFSMVKTSEALAAISAVGGIIGIATVVVLVFGAIEGVLERQRLRDAIHVLWPKCAEMKLQVERMRAITNWVDAIELWLRFPEIKDKKMMNDLLAKTLNVDYNRWTSKEVARALKDMDNFRKSWTNEDPTRIDISIVEEVPTAILELLQLQTFGTVVKNFLHHPEKFVDWDLPGLRWILDCGSYGQAFRI